MAGRCDGHPTRRVNVSAVGKQKASITEALLFQQFREHWRLIAG